MNSTSFFQPGKKLNVELIEEKFCLSFAGKNKIVFTRVYLMNSFKKNCFVMH